MAGAIWAVAEVVGGAATRLSAEAATVARQLAAASGGEAVAVVVAADPDGAAAELAAYVPRVLASTTTLAAERPSAGVIAARVAALADRERPSLLLLAATPDGRDLAGALAARMDAGVIANAMSITWDPTMGPVVEKAVLGGAAITTSTFAAGPGGPGIILLTPGAAAAEPAPARGRVEDAPVDVPPDDEPAAVAVVARVAAQATATPIEEARVIVSGGRGVGGPEGFAVVHELASLLGGSVGATRAAVDAGWIDYDRQIGQTGRTVRPDLYLALGVSGAIQHRVGMQGAGTVIAVNRDPDAPFAESADLFVVGDLFAVAPILAGAIRARRG